MPGLRDEIDRECGVTRKEWFQARREHGRDHPLRSGDPDVTVEPRVPAGGLVLGDDGLRLHLFRVRKDALTGRRQRPARSGTDEQPRAELALEGGDAPADRWLGDTE